MKAWNGWYHVNGNTYGTWLPGDPRGWREKRHRKHVAGDYKNLPPSGSGAGLHRHSRQLLTHQPVHLNQAQRQIAGQGLVEMLVRDGTKLLAVSMGAIHYHILGRFSDKQVLQRVGQAKRHAYYLLRARWQMKKVWQRLSNVTPIADRPHQVRVFRYVREHKEQGAWVWTFRDGLYWRDHAEQ